MAIAIASTEQEQLLARAVDALQATGTDGFTRAIVPVSRVFAFLSRGEFLNLAEIRIAATAKRAAHMGNLPTHRRLATAAFAFYTLGSETTPAECAEWVTVLGEQVADLASTGTSSPEVRAQVIRDLFDAKSKERAQRIAAAAEGRKQLVAVAPKVAVSLLTAESLLGDEFTLDANTADELRKAYDSIGRILGLN